ncbi:MAG: sulfurtransferase TusA family protein [Desulfuromonadaceae bacterium]|nr:sulfurtransferase TusA family protein [Desulfuromonadaceae bacterium]
MERLEFDICGQICPSALLTALREVNRYKQVLRAGTAQLLVYTDARDATHTIPEAVENMGYQVVVEPCPQGYRLCIYVERA